MSPRARRRLSRFSMMAGAVLMAAGGGIGTGAIPIGLGGQGDPHPTPGPYGDGPSATAVAEDVSPAPTATEVAEDVSPAPTLANDPPAGSSPAPSAPATPWFADDFDAEGAWPIGPLDWATTSIAGGLYRIDAQPTDLPVFITGATGEGSPGSALTVRVQLNLSPDADPATSAGTVIEDAAGERIVALVRADGRVALLRDSVESLDLIGSGEIAPPTGMIELSLTLADGSAVVSIDGQTVAAARTSVVPIAFGLAVWAASRPTSIEVDSYAIWIDGGATSS